VSTVMLEDIPQEGSNTSANYPQLCVTYTA